MKTNFGLSVYEQTLKIKVEKMNKRYGYKMYTDSTRWRFYCLVTEGLPLPALSASNDRA